MKDRKNLAPYVNFKIGTLLFNAGGTEDLALELEKVLPSLPLHKASHEQRVVFVCVCVPSQCYILQLRNR